MAGPTVSVVIPTVNRPGPLAECLAALRVQTLAPLEILVVDASADAKSEELVRSQAGAFPCALRCLRAERGSCRQRNAGAAAARGSVIAFLDDDCVPEPGYLAAVSRSFAGDSEGRLGGVQGVIVTQGFPGRFSAALMRAAGYDISKAGRFLRNGFNIPVGWRPPDLPPFQADWLCGASAFRAEVFREERFAESLESRTGYAMAEDVDFSLRAGRRWRWLIVPAARLQHQQAAGGARPSPWRQGWLLGTSRYRLFREHVSERGAGTWLAYLWSVLAWPPAVAVLKLRAGRFAEALLEPAGMLAGACWALLRGKAG